MATGKVMFGEWLPDLARYENPGLVTADNAYPFNKAYAPFFPLETPSGTPLPATPAGLFIGTDSDGSQYAFAGTLTKLYDQGVSITNNWTDRSGATTFTMSDASYFWSFAQFDDEVVATNFSDVPVSKDIGSTDDFATLATTGTAPKARVCGVIGRFLILGDTDDGTHVPSRIAWSAIDDIHTWETPETSAALAVQSGAQVFPQEYGPVTAIASGSLWGLVFQRYAIHRLRYVGGDTVFQIETISRNIGCSSPRSVVERKGVFYFWSSDGIKATDGNEVLPIGKGKVDETVQLASLDNRQLIVGALDERYSCVVWAYTASVALLKLLFYNYQEDRFGSADLACNTMAQGRPQDGSDYTPAYPWFLNSSYYLTFLPALGTASTATFTTGEAELNEGGRVFISGVRPLVSNYSSAKSPTSITVALATRNTQDEEGLTFGSNTSRTSRTGMCDFRTGGRYVSAKTIITSGSGEDTFRKAVGLQFEYDAEGAV